jgi:Zn-dependent protease with chaperone function
MLSRIRAAVYGSSFVTRILPLIPLFLWLVQHDQSGAAGAAGVADPSHVPWLALLWMMLGLLVIVTFMALWARLLLAAHRDSSSVLPTRGFHLGMFVARVASIVWFGVALFHFDFGTLVDTLLRPLDPIGLRLPGIFLATSPALLSWFGLAWAAYPVERAAREQNLLVEIDAGMTPRSPPTLRQSLSSSFRMQVLFLLAPVLAVAALQDAVLLGCRVADITLSNRVEAVAFIASSLLVFITSPELLVTVLHARPLADSPLRRRLEALATRLDLRYRDILVWHTSYGVGNAAVMGLLPRFRYILLTDLLIETLSDEQIEAVFAHEAGHVKHRHLLWYVAFWAMFLLCCIGPSDYLLREIQRLQLIDDRLLQGLVFAATFTAYIALFGMVSRLFEQQADVFAARSIELLRVPETTAQLVPMTTPVGSIGAESFVSALSRVAEISNRPVMRRSRRRRNLFTTAASRLADVAVNFTHPSIPDRIEHLRGLAMQPALTTRFDRKVVLVMLAMLVLLMSLSAWVLVAQFLAKS